MTSFELPASGMMRPIDALRDTLQVADLVESCFKLDQDAEGRHVMRQMRLTAERHRQQAQLLGHSRFPGAPQGVVWEEDGKVVGNVSVLPYQSGFRRIALLANVAVAEAYRGRGIASGLTRQALRQVFRAAPTEVWLQVRSDNNPVVRMYRNLGFESFSSVVQWQFRVPDPPEYRPQPRHYQIVEPGFRDWRAHKAALAKAYPEKVRWYAPFSFELLSPWAKLNPRYWVDKRLMAQFAAKEKGKPEAFISLVAGDGLRDYLVLAAENDEPQALKALLDAASRQARPGQILQLEFPAGRAERVLEEFGFKAVRRLDWMHLPGNKASRLAGLGR